MEAWTFFRYLICITPYFQYLQASRPFYYIGCFKEKSFSNRDNTFYQSSIMTGSVCMKICHSKSSRYAVTKSKNCFCTKNISLYTESFECNYKCPRKKTEICGGKTSVSIYDTGVAVQTTFQSTTSNSSNKNTSEIAGGGTDYLVSVYISVPVLIMAVVAISIGTIYRRRKRLNQRNSYRNRPRATRGNSDGYLSASLPTNLQHHDNSYASIPNTHSENRVTNVDNNYLNESLQSNISHPAAVNTDGNYASGSSHRVPIVSSVEHEYVDISYEELLSQREDNHCYSQLKTKRQKQRNSFRNRPRATRGNSDGYLNASLPTNLQHHTYSYASIPNTHSDHRVTDVDNSYLNESLQSNISHPAAADTESNYASGSSHGVPIVFSVEHEYVDINYEELLSQRKDNHCYNQLKP